MWGLGEPGTQQWPWLTQCLMRARTDRQRKVREKAAGQGPGDQDRAPDDRSVRECRRADTHARWRDVRRRAGLVGRKAREDEPAPHPARSERQMVKGSRQCAECMSAGSLSPTTANCWSPPSLQRMILIGWGGGNRQKKAEEFEEQRPTMSEPYTVSIHHCDVDKRRDDAA
eukprot:329848-Rhodomonas_salina.5